MDSIGRLISGQAETDSIVSPAGQTSENAIFDPESSSFLTRSCLPTDKGTDLTSFNSSLFSSGSLTMGIVNAIPSAIQGQASPLTLFINAGVKALFVWNLMFCAEGAVPDWDDSIDLNMEVRYGPSFVQDVP